MSGNGLGYDLNYQCKPLFRCLSDQSTEHFRSDGALTQLRTLQAAQRVSFHLPLQHPGLAYLRQHCVKGTPLMPAAAFFEMAAASATQLHCSYQTTSVVAVAISAPLQLTNYDASNNSTLVLLQLHLQAGTLAISSASGDRIKPMCILQTS